MKKQHAHHCHANGCSILTEPKLFMCLKHWKMVPALMQKNIWDEYKGTTREERFEKNSYLEACAIAVEYVANLEGKSIENGYRRLIEINNKRIKNYCTKDE